jgi:hypothetical protein
MHVQDANSVRSPESTPQSKHTEKTKKIIIEKKLKKTDHALHVFANKKE